MSTLSTIARHTLIINKLRRRPSSLKEIETDLVQAEELRGYKLKVDKKTFRRDLDAILSLYQIDIQYDFKRKVYFINDNGQQEASNQLLEAFDVFNVLKINEGLSQYVHFENRKPKGTENLYGLLHAIKNKYRITFDFEDYWEDLPTNYNAEPFGLKEFKNRWYLLAINLADGQNRRFPLDRLTNLEITTKSFINMAGHSADKMYENCFGVITTDDDEPSEIKLLFDEYQGNYIKSLPLHSSQEVISDTEDGLQIKLIVYITYDFIMELLSYGENVKVLKPEALANEMKELHRRAFVQY